MQLLRTKTRKFRLMSFAVAICFGLFLLAQPAEAAPDRGTGASGSSTAQTTSNNKTPPSTVSDKEINDKLKKNPIVKDLNLIVNFLSAGVGLVVVIVIIVGGIQYSMAGDNPQAVSAARQRILNGLIALMVFLFMFAFLQWLVPGGVFNSTP